MHALIFEELDEEQILKIDKDGDVANCGVTEYAFFANGAHGPQIRLKRYDFVAPLLADRDASECGKRRQHGCTMSNVHHH